MSNHQPQLGFVLPPNQPSYPSYPQGQQGYQPQNTPYPPPAYQHQPFPAPIQNQPPFGGPILQQGSTQWFGNSDFASYLRNATSFHVKQKIELLEILAGWETENKYTVKDQAGHKIFYVGEQSNPCSRLCWGKMRGFFLDVKDMRGQSVLTFERPLDCSCFCGLCNPDTLSVNTPNGQRLGVVQEKCNLLYPKFKLKNAANQTVLKVEGPLCPMAFGCGGSVVFRLLTPQGVSIGTISKEWSGFVRELFTDADYFSISFPIDLDPSMKAVCLGVLFLIDYEYFERGGGSSEQGGRRLFA